MPIYEYVCSSCGLKFELLRSLSQAGESVSCLRCHNSAEQVFSTFASFSKSGSGLTTSLAGGSSCASCGSSNCDTCGL
ncbi:zinc ribbon domain-containing protein [Chloroflexota bacterium]